MKLFIIDEIREELKHEETQETVVGGTSAALPLPRNDAANTINAEKYILPFELACQCSVPRVVVIALDCLQVCKYYRKYLLINITQIELF